MSNSVVLIQDLSRAVERLTEALKTPTDTDLLKAGCIQYFEFTFELAWKSVKALAEEAGVQDCNSPRAAGNSSRAPAPTPPACG